MKKDLLSVADLTASEIWGLIEHALELKRSASQQLLPRKVLALLFEKPSLRTRVSFEVAMNQLGGHALYLSPQEVGLGKREASKDVAKTLSRYVDGIVVRTFNQSTVKEIADHASVPVINGLTDAEHPCQALSDLMTIYEKKGTLKSLSLAFVGDANNVAHSLLLACCLMGMEFRGCFPPGYNFRKEVLSQAKEFAAESGAKLSFYSLPQETVRGADVIYTDVWISMGQEGEAEKRRKDFAGYQVNDALLSFAPHAIFMHPLPAHHGEEISRGLLDHPQSVVFNQAENRLHLQKALLVELMGVN